MFDEILIAFKRELLNDVQMTIRDEFSKFKKDDENEKINSENGFLNTKEALLILKISRPTLYKLMKKGTVSYKRIGRKLLFNKKQILENLK
ncbi:MAG: helix-turn-helix domain-containing protein [Ignavibacteriales bacterium]|nr:MAG: helix-turn-helix domain-containing protein [Ignavibacteriales bacterium]